MNTLRILVHYGKDEDQYWLADTPARAQQAREELFNQLDRDGCYDEDQYEYDYEDKHNPLKFGRRGNPRAISNILESRRTAEYEGWEYEDIPVPDNNSLPGTAELLGFNTYQQAAHKTAEYPRETGIMYTALGLAGESGEVAEKILELIRVSLWVAQHAGKTANQAKKIYRDDEGVLTPNRKKAIAHELGGVLWYVAELATLLGIDLATIPADNLRVLYERKARGKIKGDGDNR